MTGQKNCAFYLNLNISRGGPMKIWSGSLIVWVDSTFYDSATQNGVFLKWGMLMPRQFYFKNFRNGVDFRRRMTHIS